MTHLVIYDGIIGKLIVSPPTRLDDGGRLVFIAQNELKEMFGYEYIK
jgi:hypothetical protein